MTRSTQDGRTEHLLRDLTPQVLGALMRRFDDFATAEDAVQEALLAAATQWARDGLPDDPRAWLVRVASRRMMDYVRSETARRRREAVAATEAADSAPPPDVDAPADGDDTLRLVFMCCHPSLTQASAIALTLRAVGGLTTAEIASAFLVPEATMAQRISRAKQTIRSSGVPFRLPSPAERQERQTAVLHVLYLVFNEGYTTSTGETLHRTDLSAEAIRLTRAVHAQLPEDGEVAGLLALMLLTDARRAARTGPRGELVPLTEQDRSLWNRALIDEGVALVSATLSRGSIGPYQLQAAVSALHDEAERVEDTDWPQILALYGLLERMSDNPLITLNRAVAMAMVRGPAAGLELLATLDGDARLSEHHRLDAVRAHLLELAGAVDDAIRHYHSAAGRTANQPEQHYLLTRAARLAERAGTDAS